MLVFVILMRSSKMFLYSPRQTWKIWMIYLFGALKTAFCWMKIGSLYWCGHMIIRGREIRSEVYCRVKVMSNYHISGIITISRHYRIREINESAYLWHSQYLVCNLDYYFCCKILHWRVPFRRINSKKILVMESAIFYSSSLDSVVVLLFIYIFRLKLRSIGINILFDDGPMIFFSVEIRRILRPHHQPYTFMPSDPRNACVPGEVRGNVVMYEY